jgi:Uma2 family endonuclease
MRPQLAPEDLMTIEEFLAFTETRPDDERWELIEGIPVMQASATRIHQTIVANIVTALRSEKARLKAPWHVLLGVGTRVPLSPNSLPQPDVMVTEEPATSESSSMDGLVLFEVLSKSNTKSDRLWRLGVYKSVPNCQHYVTIEQTRVEVVCYDRAGGWQPRKLVELQHDLELMALGAALPLSEIYFDTPLARAVRPRAKKS